VSYRVRLRLRLENLKAYSVPKRCSSCGRKPATERRVLHAEHRAPRREGQRIRWAIQLPLCQTCHAMAEVLHNYRPSRHGPLWRAAGNRWAAGGLLVLALMAIGILWVPTNRFVEWTASLRYLASGVSGVAFVSLYLWNYWANRRARVVAYRNLAEAAGIEFGDVRAYADASRGGQGPVLVFDNDDFGRAFADSNREHVVIEGEDHLIEEPAPRPKSTAQRIGRLLLDAFRVR